MPTDSFLYLGYLPRRSSERLALAGQLASLAHTLIFLESPHRLLASLKDLQEGLGDRQIAIAAVRKALGLPQLDSQAKSNEALPHP